MNYRIQTAKQDIPFEFVFLAAKIIRISRYVVMKLSTKYLYKDVYENCLSQENCVEYSGVGFSVFYDVCYPYPIFCSTRIIHKIHGKAVAKILPMKKRTMGNPETPYNLQVSETIS
jgi:hypothetical protein